jgi:arsenical pump membrane protein
LPEVVAVVALLGVLAVAIARPRRVPEAAVAVTAAGLLILLGVVSPAAARHEIGVLGPTVGFLAAILVLGHLCAEEGLFSALGELLAGASRGRPTRLLGLVFAAAATVTAVLSLDATVVLLTPVVFATTAGLGLRARPQVYACTHLANAGSLLLPVSNLTNLLAFAASDLSFGRFALLMAAPWLVVLAVEYLAFRYFFAADLAVPAPAPAERAAAEVPLFALVTVAATLFGFGLSSPLGVDPAWIAAAGAAALAVRRRTGPRALLRAASPGFCLFVLGLGVVVRGVQNHGLGHLVAQLLPHGTYPAALLLVAAIAAVLANLLNNLPATLVLLPAATGHPATVLAVLVGVNVGPNLTYVGSLATLLWRRIADRHDHPVALGEFLRLGLLTVPAGIAAAILALWIGLTVWPA